MRRESSRAPIYLERYDVPTSLAVSSVEETYGVADPLQLIHLDTTPMKRRLIVVVASRASLTIFEGLYDAWREDAMLGPLRTMIDTAVVPE